jgi:hypothetical protein
MRNTGAARLALLDDDSLGPALAALLDQPRKSELDRSERAPISQNCARQAAIEVMRLAAPDLRYDDAVEGLDDHLLGEARRCSIDLGDLCEVARGLAGQAPRSATHDPTLALDASLRLLVHSRSIAMQTPSLMRLLNACAAKVGAMNESAAEGFADAMIALMAEPGIAAQASVLNLFLRILPNDRSVEGAPFIQRLHKLLVVAKTRQLDLFALARIAQEHADAGRNGGLLAFLAGIDDELRGQEGMRR